MIEEAGQEGTYLEQCKHKNIAKHNNDEIGETLYFVAYEGTSQTLKEFFVSENKKLSTEVFAKISRQLLSAIQYIHEQKLYFKDISLRQILVDEKHNIKITQVSAEHKVSKKEVTEKFLVSSKSEDIEQFFYPPEFLEIEGEEIEIQENANVWNEQADIWVFGMILYALSGATQQQIVEFTKTEGDLPDQEDLDEQLYMHLLGILHRNPKERTSIEDIKNNLNEVFAEIEEENNNDNNDDNDSKFDEEENKDQPGGNLFKMLGLPNFG